MPDPSSISSILNTRSPVNAVSAPALPSRSSLMSRTCRASAFLTSSRARNRSVWGLWWILFRRWVRRLRRKLRHGHGHGLVRPRIRPLIWIWRWNERHCRGLLLNLGKFFNSHRPAAATRLPALSLSCLPLSTSLRCWNQHMKPCSALFGELIVYISLNDIECCDWRY